MTRELVRTEVATAPDLRTALAQIEVFVSEHSVEDLNEVRLRAEAQALYEKRSQGSRFEREYATLRVFAEAGLGVLAFDSPGLLTDTPNNARTNWRALACALERGKLLEVCQDCQHLSSQKVAGAVRSRGLTYVPGKTFGEAVSLPWSKARVMAREAGRSLLTLPADSKKRHETDHLRSRQAQRMRRIYEAADRLDRMKRQKIVAALAKEHSPTLDTAYGLLRKTLQAMHDAQIGMSAADRKHLDRILSDLYAAEDSLGMLLRTASS